MNWLLLRLIRFYQLAISPLTGASCRYRPTCSLYAHQALTRFGAWRGSLLAIRRLARCRPGRTGGYDPVPDSLTADQSARITIISPDARTPERITPREPSTA